jgi:hypothetical protein
LRLKGLPNRVGRFRQLLNEQHGVATQAVDPEAGRTEQSDEQQGDGKGPRNVEGYQAAHERLKRVADDDAQHKWDEHDLSPHNATMTARAGTSRMAGPRSRVSGVEMSDAAPVADSLGRHEPVPLPRPDRSCSDAQAPAADEHAPQCCFAKLYVPSLHCAVALGCASVDGEWVRTLGAEDGVCAAGGCDAGRALHAQILRRLNRVRIFVAKSHPIFLRLELVAPFNRLFVLRGRRASYF